MMSVSHTRQGEIRLLIANFLAERLAGKAEKLAPGDPGREELRRQFSPALWLEDAARRVAQLQAVTHTLKPIHPDARGTNLYCPPDTLSALDCVGSHVLGGDFAGDVVGNAAALDVYKFLKLEYAGRTLLALAVEGDADLAAALSDDPAQATAWMQAFAALTRPRGRVASHTLAKQVFWPVAADADGARDGGATPDVHGDASFHLLAPLYASSLAHRVYARLQDDRFGEAAKLARAARKEGAFSERDVHEYPQLAVQQQGGTKPQNISQLTSERRGNNYLLASLPPVWRSTELKPLHHTTTLFLRYGRRPEVRHCIKALRTFLMADPARNLATRDTRKAMVEDLLDAFLQFTAEVRTLEPGWSNNPACDLSEAECYWLDPEGAAQGDAEQGSAAPWDIEDRICEAFANWLNAQLKDPLPMADPEFLEWRKSMREAIKAQEREGAYDNA